MTMHVNLGEILAGVGSSIGIKGTVGWVSRQGSPGVSPWETPKILNAKSDWRWSMEMFGNDSLVYCDAAFKESHIW